MIVKFILGTSLAFGTLFYNVITNSNENAHFASEHLNHKKSGNLIWKTELDSTIVSFPQVSQSNDVFITTYSGQIFCLNSLDGEIKWNLQLGRFKTIIEPCNITGKLIALKPSQGRLLSIDQNSGIILSDKIINEFKTTKFITTLDGSDIAISGGSDNQIYLVNTVSGEIKWATEVESRITKSPVICAKKELIIFNTSNKIYLVNRKNGKIEKIHSIDSHQLTGPSKNSPKKIYYGCNNGFLYSIDCQSGELDQVYKANASISVSPVINNQGHIFFQSDNGFNYALDSQTKKILWQKQVGLNENVPIQFNQNGNLITHCNLNELASLCNKTGRLLWRIELSEYGTIWPTSALIISDNRKKGLILSGHGREMRAYFTLR